MVVGEYGFTLTAAITGVSLATANAASFLVRKPDGTTATWGGDVNDPNVDYEVQSGDLTYAGQYRIQAQITFADGSVRRTAVGTFTVDQGV